MRHGRGDLENNSLLSAGVPGKEQVRRYPLQRLPDTRSCGGGVQTIKKEQEAGIRDVEEDQTGMRALMVQVQTQCGPTFCLLTDHLSSRNRVIITPDNVGVSYSLSQAERDDRGDVTSSDEVTRRHETDRG